MAIAPLFLIRLLNALYLSLIQHLQQQTVLQIYTVFIMHIILISVVIAIGHIFLLTGMNDDCLINRNS